MSAGGRHVAEILDRPAQPVIAVVARVGDHLRRHIRHAIGIVNDQCRHDQRAGDAMRPHLGGRVLGSERRSEPHQHALGHLLQRRGWIDKRLIGDLLQELDEDVGPRRTLHRPHPTIEVLQRQELVAAIGIGAFDRIAEPVARSIVVGGTPRAAPAETCPDSGARRSRCRDCSAIADACAAPGAWVCYSA